MVFTTWLTNLPKQLTRRSSVRKVKTGLWSRSSDAAEVLETRALLAVSDFDGGYSGTYSGSVTIPGQGTFSVPGGSTLTDNSFTANISNGSVNVNVPGIGAVNQTGTISATGVFNVSATGSLSGSGVRVAYTGTFTVGSGGVITGSGPWKAFVPAGQPGAGTQFGSGTWNATLTDPPVPNAAPEMTFPVDRDQTVLEDAGAQTVPFLTGISDGDADRTQTLTLTVSVPAADATLFAVKPAINKDTGTLTYTPAANAFGTTTVTVTLKDNGGIAGGGVDTTVETFDITITSVNDVPSFKKGADQTVKEGSGLKTETGWATLLNKGAPNESGQELRFEVTNNDNAALFSVQPAVSVNGTLTFTTVAELPGTANITVKVMDNGGTDPGVDTSATQTFKIIVTPLANKLPTITAVDDVDTDEDTATDVLTFTIGDRETPAEAPAPVKVLTLSAKSSNVKLVPNTVTNIVLGGTGANRTVQVIPAANQFGESLITITVKDGNGGTKDETFLVSVNPINDAPTFLSIANMTTKEDTPLKFTLTAGTSFKDADPDDLATDLRVRGFSDNVNVGVDVTSSADGKTRTVTLTPINNFFTTIPVFITLEVDDGENDDSAGFLLNVTPVNDAPSLTQDGDDDLEVAENAVNGDDVFRVNFTDVDAGDSASAFGIKADKVNGTEKIFSMTRVGNQGIIKVLDASKLDFEKTQSYSVTVTTTDSALPKGLTGERTFVISVTDVETDVTVNLTDGSAVTVGSAANRLVVKQGTTILATTPANLQYNDLDSLTINGTVGADNIKLLSSLNTTGVNAFLGTVTVSGGGGVDTIDARNATKFAVHLDGGAGNDKLAGGAKNDTLCGDDGDDLLSGGAGDDILIGGDTLDNGKDSLRGGTGNDTLLGMGGDDDLDGGAGDDVILGGTGGDKILGGTGADSVLGEAGSDNILGGAGDDTLDGGDDIDNINGGVGTDSINGGGGVDVVSDPDGDIDQAAADALFVFDIDEILALCHEAVLP